MPPSTDDLPGKKPAERRTRQGGMKRKPGKQPGAPGAFLAWNEHPDKTVDVFPESICRCGADLNDARDLGVKYSHQVTDLPEARAVTIQHDRHEVQCACGRTHVADAPPEAAGAPGTVTYGLNFQAWCVFLLVMQHVPVERCADILASMSGTRPSDGWVHALLERAARAVAAANTAIRALIILARVVCGDETPLRAGPRPEDPQEVPAGRLHHPAHLLLPRRPGPGLLQGLRLQRPARHRGRARPVRQLRRLRRHQPPAVHPAPAPRS
jgi:transposase